MFYYIYTFNFTIYINILRYILKYMVQYKCIFYLSVVFMNSPKSFKIKGKNKLCKTPAQMYIN